MFNKKIILLISFLLVTSSSYFIFHRKKDNNDEVNLVDNSDNSINNDINEEEPINEDVESSSSLLLVIIIIVIIIIIAAAIFFFIFYRRNKKKKEENPKKEIIIEEIEKRKKIFEEYKKFKEVEANKKEIEGIKLNRQELLKADVLIFINEIKSFLQVNKINLDDYVKNKYIIDLFNPFTNDEFENHYQENNKIVYRFNFEEHSDILERMLYRFFESIFNDESYHNNNLYSLDKEERAVYIFIATIIEPFFEAIQKKIYEGQDVTLLFAYQFDEILLLRRKFYSVAYEKSLKNRIYTFFYRALNVPKTPFLVIFTRLIKEYFNFNLKPYQ